MPFTLDPSRWAVHWVGKQAARLTRCRAALRDWLMVASVDAGYVRGRHASDGVLVPVAHLVGAAEVDTALRGEGGDQAMRVFALSHPPVIKVCGRQVSEGG